MSHLDDESIEIDLSLLCRVCLKKPLRKTDFLDLNILYDEDESKTYAECFRECTELNLEDEEVQQPRNICKACGLELQIVYDFYKKLDKSNRILELQRQRNRIKYEGSVSADEPYETDEQDEETESKEELTEFKVESISTKLDEYEAEVLDEVLEQVELLEADEPTEEDIYDAVVEDVSGLEVVHGNMAADACVIEETWSVIEDNKESSTRTLGPAEAPSSSKTLATGKRKMAPRASGSPPYKCEHCEYLSATRALLASHRHRKHRPREQRKYKCDKCSKAFDDRLRYLRHIDRPTCSSYPEFQCHYCQKILKGKGNFLIHLRFHEKEHPYVCHICAKGFALATHLNLHVKTKHENLRFVCDVASCGKTFQSQHALKAHSYKHIGVKPYQCEYCRHGFPSRGKLNFHIQRTHDIKLSLDDLDRMRVAEEISVKAKLTLGGGQQRS